MAGRDDMGASLESISGKLAASYEVRLNGDSIFSSESFDLAVEPI